MSDLIRVYGPYSGSAPNCFGSGADANAAALEVPAEARVIAICVQARLWSATTGNGSPVRASLMHADTLAGGAFLEYGTNHLGPSVAGGFGGFRSRARVRGRAATDGAASTAITCVRRGGYMEGCLTASGMTAVGTTDTSDGDLSGPRVPKVIAPGEGLVFATYMQAVQSYVPSFTWYEVPDDVLRDGDALRALLERIARFV